MMRRRHQYYLQLMAELNYTPIEARTRLMRFHKGDINIVNRDMSYLLSYRKFLKALS